LIGASKAACVSPDNGEMTAQPIVTSQQPAVCSGDARKILRAARTRVWLA